MAAIIAPLSKSLIQLRVIGSFFRGRENFRAFHCSPRPGRTAPQPVWRRRGRSVNTLPGTPRDSEYRRWRPGHAKPDQQSELEFAARHGHYHFKGFASYRLLDAQGCLSPWAQGQFLPAGHSPLGSQAERAPCFDCDHQGIQAGWGDIYDVGFRPMDRNHRPARWHLHPRTHDESRARPRRSGLREQSRDPRGGHRHERIGRSLGTRKVEGKAKGERREEQSLTRSSRDLLSRFALPFPPALPFPYPLSRFAFRLSPFAFLP